MRFRPCIDLRNGRVVQIVGGTLRDSENANVVTNFETERSPAGYASMYRDDNLVGGHVIALGPGNRDAALAALRAYPNGLQMGGGINPDNAAEFLDAGASHVIVTSYVFRNGVMDEARLADLVRAVGRERLVLDLSCRSRDGQYWVVTDRWQKFTKQVVDRELLGELSASCAEFLVHGVDVEGTRTGIEEQLVEMLGKHSPIPVTYAGGAANIEDLNRVKRLGDGSVDLTIGSALDIFGGSTSYRDVVEWDRGQR